mgnify:CR=1 FL=1
MAGDVKADNQPYDDINITPMLDLAYVLLVTLIVAGSRWRTAPPCPRCREW